jgi:cysteate synthase
VKILIKPVMGDYELVCLSCGIKIPDNFTNKCPSCGKVPTLIKTQYKEKQVFPVDKKGFWRFLPWLPCINAGIGFEGQTIVYKSEGLSKELGLSNLYIAFNGFWPDRKASLKTCTFKEFEAAPTFQRASERGVKDLVLPSAGNTARAFTTASGDFDVKLYVVVPYRNLSKLILATDVPENARIIAVNGDGDYSDAIAFARRMTSELGIVNEDGVHNVARRDGLGTVMLEAVMQISKIPHHYFQAVGSGTGGIAAWEATTRLLADGRFGERPVKLHLSQNTPFTPMVDAWNSGSRDIDAMSEERQKRAISQVRAHVLTNRNPPYSINGGVFDCLKASSGRMYSITNDELKRAGKLFMDSEEIDIQPASCVATASLIKSVRSYLIDKDDIILLNITGGGAERLKEEHDTFVIQPDIICDKDTDMEDLKDAIQ